MNSKSYPLIIRRVILEDFLSHKDSNIQFDEGVNVIIGENGAGKSSILEAIYYALTSEKWRAGKIEDLVNKNSQNARVILEFEYEGHEFRIEKEIGRDRKAFLFKDGKLIADRVESVKKTLKELIRLDPEKLNGVAIVAQGGLTELFTQTKPSERKERVDELLGLNVYEEIGEKIKEICLEVSEDIGTFCPSQSDINRLETVKKRFAEAYRELLKKRREKDEAIARCERIITEVKNKIIAEGLREKASRLDELSRERDELVQVKSRVEESIFRLREDKRELEKEILANENALREINAELKDLEEASALASVIDKFETLVKIYGEIRSRKQILESKERELSNLNRIEHRYRELAGKYGSLEALEDLILGLEGSLDEARRRLGELNDEIGRERGLLEKLKTDIEKYKREFTRLAKEARFDGNEALMNIDYLEKIHEEIKNALSQLKEDLRRLMERESDTRSRLGDYENKILILSKSTEPKCPVCGRPLDDDHRRRLLEELEKMVEEARSLLTKLESDRKRIETRDLPEIESKLDIIEKIKETLKSLLDNQEALKEHERRVDELSKLKANLEQSVRELENRIKTLEKDRSEWRNLSQIYDSEYHSRLREEVETLRQDIRNLEDKAGLFKKDLAMILRIPLEIFDSQFESIERRFREAAEARERLILLRHKKETIENNLINSREKLKKKNEELKLLETELERIRDKLEAVEKEVKNAENARELLSKLEYEIKSNEMLLQQHRLDREEIDEELKKLREKAFKANDAIKKLLILYWLKNNLFHKDGLPKYLRKHYVEVMSRIMESLSDVFDLGFESIQIDEEYSIRVKLSRIRGEFTVGQLSGGEKVAISILALLAINQIVTQGNIGFLALDEPTEYLDEERRRDLVELLKKFRRGENIPQIIVVTHDNELVEAANIVYRVVKDEFSKVVREES
ncbi:MAG: AAA family ATPase [Thermosphaera sp.]